jgi:hypothetical protein
VFLNTMHSVALGLFCASLVSFQIDLTTTSIKPVPGGFLIPIIFGVQILAWIYGNIFYQQDRRRTALPLILADVVAVLALATALVLLLCNKTAAQPFLGAFLFLWSLARIIEIKLIPDPPPVTDGAQRAGDAVVFTGPEWRRSAALGLHIVVALAALLMVAIGLFESSWNAGQTFGGAALCAQIVTLFLLPLLGST